MRAPRILALVVIAVVGLVAVGAYAAATYVVYDRVSAVEAHCGGRFAAYTPASFGTEGISAEFTADEFPTAAYAMPDYEEVGFPSRDQRQPPLIIRAWWIPAGTPDAPAVIVVHGYGSCRHDPVALLPAGMLHRNGFAVLLIDLRDQGDSDIEDGRFAGGTEEYRDVLGAWDWLVGQGVPARRIGVLGESLGAATSLIAMAEEPRVQATWEDSGFADLQVMLREELARQGYPDWLIPGGLLWARVVAGDDLTAKDPLRSVEAIGSRPLAIVHGEADRRANVHHARDLAAVHARFIPGYEAWIVPGATHVQAAFAAPVDYEQRLVDFFATNLGA
ncbi:MAG: prolyl oligopeptidase family serine peptidase [Chloroflexi bacterium]|jgi:dipeptidyl aminopeptidase/acylaminoacyl peptidase|nr:prolyl oligopeptidase family serine peptidase [Chloroflexota bacterium]